MKNITITFTALFIVFGFTAAAQTVTLGDPWLYNEYTNGRLPAAFENNKTANDISKWLIAKTHN